MYGTQKFRLPEEPLDIGHVIPRYSIPQVTHHRWSLKNGECAANFLESVQKIFLVLELRSGPRPILLVFPVDLGILISARAGSGVGFGSTVRHIGAKEFEIIKTRKEEVTIYCRCLQQGTKRHPL